MDLAALRAYCLAKPGATEDRPFGPETLVFKVMNKMFALTGDEPQPASITLKCDPDDALFFRSQFKGVTTAGYMDKRHWNAVSLAGDVPESLAFEMIDDSYLLVVAGLPLKLREKLDSR
jgi:predicted DNA-binding protein (MmcQ/YjbR family)